MVGTGAKSCKYIRVLESMLWISKYQPEMLPSYQTNPYLRFWRVLKRNSGSNCWDIRPRIYRLCLAWCRLVWQWVLNSHAKTTQTSDKDHRVVIWQHRRATCLVERCRVQSATYPETYVRRWRKPWPFAFCALKSRWNLKPWNASFSFYVANNPILLPSKLYIITALAIWTTHWS